MKSIFCPDFKNNLLLSPSTWNVCNILSQHCDLSLVRTKFFRFYLRVIYRECIRLLCLFSVTHFITNHWIVHLCPIEENDNPFLLKLSWNLLSIAVSYMIFLSFVFVVRYQQIYRNSILMQLKILLCE